MKQQKSELTVNVAVKYRVEVSLLDCIKSRIIGTQLMEEHLKDMIDTKDENISNEEITTLPCGCEVMVNSIKQHRKGPYCYSSGVELHDKCSILYYSGIGIKHIWWILGKKENKNMG